MTLLRTQLGTTLRGHRLRQRRTLRDVSGAARVSLGYLSEVERGQKEASSELLASICDALDLELADLLAEVSLELRGSRTARPAAVRPVADEEAAEQAAAEQATPAAPPPSPRWRWSAPGRPRAPPSAGVRSRSPRSRRPACPRRSTGAGSRAGPRAAGRRGAAGPRRGGGASSGAAPAERARARPPGAAGRPGR